MLIPTKATGDQHTAAELNQVKNEIEHVIADSGQTPSASETDQLSHSIGMMRLSSTDDVNLDDAATTETSLYTVPTSHFAVITQVVIRNPTSDASSAKITLGLIGGDCDEWLGGVTNPILLTSLDGTDNDYVCISLPQGTTADPVPNGSPVFVAADEFGVEMSVKAGAECLVTIDVFGYVYHA